MPDGYDLIEQQATPLSASLRRSASQHEQHGSRPGSRTPGRAGRAGDLPQSRQRLLRAAGQGSRAPRPRDRARPCRLDLGRRVRPGVGQVGSPSRAWPAVQGGLPEVGSAVIARGHGEVPGLGADQGHRPGLREEAGQGVRRGRVRRHRAAGRAADRGRRHRSQAGLQDPAGLERPESHPRDHGVPADPTASAPRGRFASTRPTGPTRSRW